MTSSNTLSQPNNAWWSDGPVKYTNPTPLGSYWNSDQYHGDNNYNATATAYMLEAYLGIYTWNLTNPTLALQLSQGDMRFGKGFWNAVNSINDYQTDLEKAISVKQHVQKLLRIGVNRNAVSTDIVTAAIANSKDVNNFYGPCYPCTIRSDEESMDFKEYIKYFFNDYLQIEPSYAQTGTTNKALGTSTNSGTGTYGHTTTFKSYYGLTSTNFPGANPDDDIKMGLKTFIDKRLNYVISAISGTGASYFSSSTTYPSTTYITKTQTASANYTSTLANLIGNFSSDNIFYPISGYNGLINANVGGNSISIVPNLCQLLGVPSSKDAANTVFRMLEQISNTVSSASGSSSLALGSANVPSYNDPSIGPSPTIYYNTIPIGNFSSPTYIDTGSSKTQPTLYSMVQPLSGSIAANLTGINTVITNLSGVSNLTQGIFNNQVYIGVPTYFSSQGGSSNITPAKLTVVNANNQNIDNYLTFFSVIGTPYDYLHQIGNTAGAMNNAYAMTDVNNNLYTPTLFSLFGFPSSKKSTDTVFTLLENIKSNISNSGVLTVPVLGSYGDIFQGGNSRTVNGTTQTNYPFSIFAHFQQFLANDGTLYNQNIASQGLLNNILNNLGTAGSKNINTLIAGISSAINGNQSPNSGGSSAGAAGFFGSLLGGLGAIGAALGLASGADALGTGALAGSVFSSLSGALKPNPQTPNINTDLGTNISDSINRGFVKQVNSELGKSYGNLSDALGESVEYTLLKDMNDTSSDISQVLNNKNVIGSTVANGITTYSGRLVDYLKANMGSLIIGTIETALEAYFGKSEENKLNSLATSIATILDDLNNLLSTLQTDVNNINSQLANISNKIDNISSQAGNAVMNALSDFEYPPNSNLTVINSTTNQVTISINSMPQKMAGKSLVAVTILNFSYQPTQSFYQSLPILITAVTPTNPTIQLGKNQFTTNFLTDNAVLAGITGNVVDTIYPKNNNQYVSYSLTKDNTFVSTDLTANTITLQFVDLANNPYVFNKPYSMKILTVFA